MKRTILHNVAEGTLIVLGYVSHGNDLFQLSQVISEETALTKITCQFRRNHQTVMLDDRQKHARPAGIENRA